MLYHKLVKSQLKFFIKLALISALLFSVHYYILYSFFKSIVFSLELWLIYSVHFFLVFIIFSIINYRFHIGKKDIFNLFMLGTLLKMVLIIIFLLPLILSEQKNKIPDVLNFFLPYFIFLGFEVYIISQILNKK